MATTTEICNMALSHLGVGKDVSNVDTEKSNEARAFNRFYPTAIEAMLRDFPWPFAIKMATLALVEDNQDESDILSEWEFSYQYPADCVEAKRIVSMHTTDNRQSRIPYRIITGASGPLILSNWPNAVLEYAGLLPTTALFPADFTLALSYRMACYMAARVTGGDPFKLAPRCMQAYQIELASARANAANEEQSDQIPEAEMIRIRNGDPSPWRNRPW